MTPSYSGHGVGLRPPRPLPNRHDDHDDNNHHYFHHHHHDRQPQARAVVAMNEAAPGVSMTRYLPPQPSLHDHGHHHQYHHHHHPRGHYYQQSLSYGAPEPGFYPLPRPELEAHAQHYPTQSVGGAPRWQGAWGPTPGLGYGPQGPPPARSPQRPPPIIYVDPTGRQPPRGLPQNCVMVDLTGKPVGSRESPLRIQPELLHPHYMEYYRQRTEGWVPLTYSPSGAITVMAPWDVEWHLAQEDATPHAGQQYQHHHQPPSQQWYPQRQERTPHHQQYAQQSWSHQPSQSQRDHAPRPPPRPSRGPSPVLSLSPVPSPVLSPSPVPSPVLSPSPVPSASPALSPSPVPNPVTCDDAQAGPGPGPGPAASTTREGEAAGCLVAKDDAKEVPALPTPSPSPLSPLAVRPGLDGGASHSEARANAEDASTRRAAAAEESGPASSPAPATACEDKAAETSDERAPAPAPLRARADATELSLASRSSAPTTALEAGEGSAGHGNEGSAGPGNEGSAGPGPGCVAAETRGFQEEAVEADGARCGGSIVQGARAGSVALDAAAASAHAAI